MSNIEKDQDVQLEEQIEQEDVEQEEQNVQEEEQTDWKAEALKYKAILERTKKKAEKPATTKSQNTNIEEVVLKAQGVTSEELDVLKKIAQIQGVSVIDARNDDYFVNWKKKQEEEKQREATSMPASRGSRTSPLSIEERKARFMKSENPSREEIRELIRPKKN